MTSTVHYIRTPLLWHRAIGLAKNYCQMQVAQEAISEFQFPADIFHQVLMKTGVQCESLFIFRTELHDPCNL